MTQEQIKAVWGRKVAWQTALNALADLPENKRALSELRAGIDTCNTELVSGTYNPPPAGEGVLWLNGRIYTVSNYISR